jgi:hypothetical protein
MARSHGLAVGLATLCTLAVPTAAQAGVDFGRGTTFQADGIVSSLATADLNGDKKVDLVAPYSFTPTITNPDPASKGILVVLGDGRGGGTSHTQGLGTALTSIAVGDFNGDAKQDIVGTFDDGNGSAGVSLLLGDGAGGFAEAGLSAAGAHPADIVRSDFNGDGKLDVAAIDRGTNDISILLGAGNGSFGAASTVALASPPTSLSVADVNADKKMDLVATTTTGATVRHGNGAGQFPSGTPVSIPGGANDAAVRDVNGDKRTDIAVVTTSTNSVSVLLGKAGGGFTLGSPAPAGSAPRKVFLADLDLDGKADLGIFGEESGAGHFRVHTGDGHGAFETLGSFPTGRTGGVISDFNGDKALDIAAGSGEFGSAGTSRESVRVDLNVPVAAGANLDFGTQVARGPEVTKTVTITNSGAAPLHVAALSFTGKDAKDFSVTPTACIRSPIARKKTCSLKIGFSPEGLGTRTASLVVKNDTAAGATTYDVKGRGKRNAGVGIRHQTLHLDSHGGIHLRVSCPGPRKCTGELSLRTTKSFRVQGSKKAKHVTVGRKRFSMSPGARHTIVVPAKKAARSLLKRRGSLRVKVGAAKQGAFVKRVSFKTTLHKRR